jgi:AcrR family transcriptional regulator
MTTPREIRKERNREAIIKAARQLIINKGVDEFSLREVARAVDYSPAAIYEYFDNKDDLIATVAQVSIGRLARRLGSVSKDLPPEERLVGLGMAYLAFAAEDTEEFVLCFASLQMRASSLQLSLDDDEAFQILFQAVGAFLQSIGKTLPEEELILAAYHFWGLVHGLATLRNGYLANVQVDFKATHRQAIRTMVQGWRET